MNQSPAPSVTCELSPGIVHMSKVRESCLAASDEELASRLERVSTVEKRVSAILVAHLGEFDVRKLWAEAGYTSLFSYCTSKLGMSEQAAYKRIAAARAAIRYPEILDRLADGRIHLSSVAVLAPHLTDENVSDVLERAIRKTKYELEKIVAALHPRPDRRDFVRALPSPIASPMPVGEPPPIETLGMVSSSHTPDLIPEGRFIGREEPLSPGRVHFGFTGSEALREKIKRVKELTWHCDPAGRLEVVIERLADYYLDRKDPDRRIARKEARVRRRREAATPTPLS